MATDAIRPSPLLEMTQSTRTRLWSDSADPDDLRVAISHGAVGATCNPVIAHGILKRRQAEWRPRLAALATAMPTATEDAIGWRAVEQLSADTAALLRPAFETHQGRDGRLSIQTDPRLHRDPAALLVQARRFAALAPNMIVKLPATAAGIAAMEAATSEGISVNATVCFTLPQCVAVAEAIERGLATRTRRGEDISTMGPVCTIMVGRLDDWLKVVLERDAISTDPGHLEWAGVAVFKKTYRLFQQRGYRVRLLSAAFRNHMHWSEFIGGDVVISPPPAWQQRFVHSDIAVRPRIDDPVAPAIVDDLYRRFADFRRAYDDDGLDLADFEDYPPTRRTLRQFLAAVADINALVRDVLVPDPDVRA